jgi:hypothetical protein
MFLAHSIRLRDPWQRAILPGGAVRWSRVFHRPTGLEQGDSLVLVISGLPAEAVVTVNGVTFQRRDEAPGQFDVTHVLQEHNCATIELPATSAVELVDDATFPFDARLAIVARS